MEYIQGTLFGRMSHEHSVQTTEKTLMQFSENSQGSLSQTLPMCLSLKMDGVTREYYWSPGGGKLLGELMTRNTGKRPSATAVQEMCLRLGRHSVAEESHLSQILEDSPLPKYFLSAKACQGILNRAKRRGKELPPRLKDALEAQTAL